MNALNRGIVPNVNPTTALLIGLMAMMLMVGFVTPAHAIIDQNVPADDCSGVSLVGEAAEGALEKMAGRSFPIADARGQLSANIACTGNP